MENTQTQGVNQDGLPTDFPDTLNSRNYWSSDDNIVIKGIDFETIANFLGMFRAPLIALDKAVEENKRSGVIKTEFYDEKGNVVSQELVNRIYQTLRQRELQTGEVAQFIPAQQVNQQPPQTAPVQQVPEQVVDVIPATARPVTEQPPITLPVPQV